MRGKRTDDGLLGQYSYSCQCIGAHHTIFNAEVWLRNTEEEGVRSAKVRAQPGETRVDNMVGSLDNSGRAGFVPGVAPVPGPRPGSASSIWPSPTILPNRRPHSSFTGQ